MKFGLNDLEHVGVSIVFSSNFWSFRFEAAPLVGQLTGAGTDTAVGDQQTDLVVRMRQMEVDLKRKSDLLSEVKVLLKQAADRERQQESGELI